MSTHPLGEAPEECRPQKRKRGQADVSRQLQSPCNKAARSCSYIVFLCGFSDRERRELRRRWAEELDIVEEVSTSVTHIVVKPPTKKDKYYPYSALFYAYEKFRHHPDEKVSRIFMSDVFGRVLVLSGRSSEGKQKRAALRR
ncbi:unnamed protein product [Heligmosomoides polygyrus]|uniref:Hexosyltransferase n=1 Tax=Heligmosomoides polygyrus TaxID=6339 RepID=A0A183F840_HELPZ|nr:unnamed protein product [Heligmosomoides polygyrus]